MPAPRAPCLWPVLAIGLWAGGAGAAMAEAGYAARYDGPTTRYAHGVLGDDVEYTTLIVTMPDGRIVRTTWDAPVVFEDLAPRLIDLDGDAIPEIITVEAHDQNGARLALWRIGPDGLTPLASTPWIGTRFRWLAPVGAGDLDGDGHLEIAYIDRPHLARTLRIWRYLPQDAGRGHLVEVATAPGLTNHRIGQDFITGGLRDCGAGPEIVTANADWTRIMASVLAPGATLTSRPIAPFTASGMAAALACQD